jgi:hypothetical protein
MFAAVLISLISAALLSFGIRRYNAHVANYWHNEMLRANTSLQLGFQGRQRILRRLQSLELNLKNREVILFLLAQLRS